MLIVFAAIGVAVGVAGWIVGKRKGDRLAGRAVLLGIPGVYLAGLASWGESRWLYVPGLSLMAGAVLVQVVGWRQGSSRSTDDRLTSHESEGSR
jgi:hypothetical protein